jgi:hypothetical protein
MFEVPAPPLPAPPRAVAAFEISPDGEVQTLSVPSGSP